MDMNSPIINISNNINMHIADYKTQVNRIKEAGNGTTFREALECFICQIKFLIHYGRWPDSEYINSHTNQVPPQFQELISWLSNDTRGSTFILRNTNDEEMYEFTCLGDSISIAPSNQQDNYDNNCGDGSIIINKGEFIRSSDLSNYIHLMRRQDLSKIINLLEKIGFPLKFIETIPGKISDDELRSYLKIDSLYEKICNICDSYILNVNKQDKTQMLFPKHLCFNGGGSKGIYYAPVMDVLKKVGYLKELNSVYGTSVGSMAATLEAFNINMSEITDLAMGCDDIINDNYITQYPEFVLSNNSGIANGIASISRLEKKIMCALKSWFDTKANIPSELDDIKNKVDFYFKNPDALRYDSNMISFGDLQKLNQYDNNFKLLSITATEKLTGKSKLFSASDTPDIPICKAVRASTAYPMAFKGVVINDIEYVDGGLHSNSSLAAVKETDLNTTASLLFFRPDQNGWSDFYDRIYGCSEHNEYDFKRSAPVQAALGNFLVNNYSENENNDAKRIYNVGHNAIPVWHGEGDDDIGTFSFNIQDDIFAYNSFIAKMYIYNYLNNYWV
ncbi:Patatin-like phospholipase [Escherichia coli]|uniref:patatin-like phospholipase family protein n=1 Tax=Escherichia coli TaxID=562 RepID=UPI000DA5B4D3|nr:patatin-like phospholipase family protein [Escherichia coli]SQM12134.1 Patatin-like phospholipase [Escherichia coli]SQM26720.1 Patatin-like phospholipase [Escherichia coli]